MKKHTGLRVYETLANNRVPRTLLWAVVVAFAVRLVVVGFVYQGFLDPGRDHWEFGYETGKIATSIVTGHGFSNPYYWADTGPTAELAPVFPYLLAGVMALFGVYTKAAALAMLTVNSLFSALTCVPIFFLAKKSFGFREARWATWTWVFFPYAVYFSAGSIWDHALTALLLTLLLLIALHLESSTRLWAWGGFGILGGVTALVCPVVLGTLPFIAGWVCYRLHRQKRNWSIPAGTAALTVLATIAPWLIRNYRVFHQPVFLKDVFPLEILVGNFGNTFHWWNGSVLPCGNAAELAKLQRLGEQAYMAEKWSLVFDFLKSNPRTFAWRSLRRVVYMWTGYWSFRPKYLHGEPFDPPNIIFCTTFTFLAITGLSKAFRRTPDRAMPYALVLLIYPMVYYITHSDIEYRNPLDPEIVILASYAVVSWRRSRQESKRQRRLQQADLEPASEAKTTGVGC
jgi:4-amino-4-deoxy-L-arabinose transferase-like glycosyltransferase